MNDTLYLDCPCTSFPRSFARDYKETYLYPPPSTVYGFLLSLVGEEDLTAHLGVKIAIGLIGEAPPVSRILTKRCSHKSDTKEYKKRVKKYGENIYPSQLYSKPNHQELLTDLKVALRLNSSGEKSKVTLVERVAIALATPGQISRFGGLSLGESWAMVNGIRPYRSEDGVIRWLITDNRGLIGLPIWIDRKTTQGTFRRFTLENEHFREEAWITIQNH